VSGAYACTPSYSGGRNQKDQGLKPPGQIRPLSKHEALSSNKIKNKKKEQMLTYATTQMNTENVNAK
jgi:hypothetical protein